MSDISDIPVEVETSLLICSKCPGSLAREIESLPTIATFSVIGAEHRVMNDYYFDAHGLDQKTWRWILRLREVNSQWLITLKGPSREAPDGIMERLELERPWSSDALQEVMSTLHFPHGSLEAGYIDSASPVEVLMEYGMAVIQHRKTERRIRNVIGNDQQVVIAEIAIDQVRYDLVGGEVVHWEIEIESKLEAYRSAVNEIAAALLKRFSPELRVWKIGKLATGKAIDSLLRRNALNSIVNEEGSMKAEVYDLIERFSENITFSL